jgi:hypothetical protein
MHDTSPKAKIRRAATPRRCANRFGKYMLNPSETILVSCSTQINIGNRYNSSVGNLSGLDMMAIHAMGKV